MREHHHRDLQATRGRPSCALGEDSALGNCEEHVRSRGVMGANDPIGRSSANRDRSEARERDSNENLVQYEWRMQFLKIICALDTGDVDEAVAIVKRLGPHVGAFKIGHALTLPHGLSIIERLREAGAHRVFLDLKFHDIPNSVALAVREATKHGVWMLTLHTSGGPAMMTAAVQEAQEVGEIDAPLLMGVSVLTSLDQHTLTDHVGIQRTIDEQMAYMSRLAIECGLDGVICPAPEISNVRRAIGNEGIIVTPGIRLSAHAQDDQRQVGTASQALSDGANYLVIGRALVDSPDPESTLERMGFVLAGR